MFSHCLFSLLTPSLVGRRSLLVSVMWVHLSMCFCPCSWTLLRKSYLWSVSRSGWPSDLLVFPTLNQCFWSTLFPFDLLCRVRGLVDILSSLSVSIIPPAPFVEWVVSFSSFLKKQAVRSPAPCFWAHDFVPLVCRTVLAVTKGLYYNGGACGSTGHELSSSSSFDYTRCFMSLYKLKRFFSSSAKNATVILVRTASIPHYLVWQRFSHAELSSYKYGRSFRSHSSSPIFPWCLNFSP